MNGSGLMGAAAQPTPRRHPHFDLYGESDCAQDVFLVDDEIHTFTPYLAKSARLTPMRTQDDKIQRSKDKEARRRAKRLATVFKGCKNGSSES